MSSQCSGRQFFKRFELNVTLLEHLFKIAPRADSDASLENIFRLKALFLPHPYPGRTLATEKSLDVRICEAERPREAD